jgi:hypothetical protein
MYTLYPVHSVLKFSREKSANFLTFISKNEFLPPEHKCDGEMGKIDPLFTSDCSRSAWVTLYSLMQLCIKTRLWGVLILNLSACPVDIELSVPGHNVETLWSWSLISSAESKKIWIYTAIHRHLLIVGCLIEQKQRRLCFIHNFRLEIIIAVNSGVLTTTIN